MKRFFAVLIALAFLCAFAFSAELEVLPSQIQEMDLNVTLGAHGGFSGTVSTADRMEVKMLTLQGSATQKIEGLSERLLIGGKEFLPKTHETTGEKKYAVFEIERLYDFVSSPEFEVKINARVKTSALMELGEDFNLSETDFSAQKEFLKQSDYIEVNDQALRSKAQLEFQSDSGLETIRGITEWVNDNIEYDFADYYAGVWSAKQTYESGKGVCDEFSNLAAAFLRIKGIPAKYVSGVSFDGKRFGNHGWLEVFQPGKGWIGVDPTYGEAGYLDATHVAVAKTVDVNSIENLVILTYSVGGLKVESSLDEPEIEIISSKQFDGLLGVELEKPDRLNLGEAFEFKATVKNLQSKSIIVPLELVLHNDFSYSERARLELFKPLEEKEIVWNAVAPKEGKPNTFAEYEAIFLAPDKKLTEKLSVYSEEGAGEPVSLVKVLDVSPFVDANTVKVSITLANSGEKDGKAEIAITMEGKTSNYSEEVKALTQKKITYSFKGVSMGTILLKVVADETKSFEITVPEKKEDVKVKELAGEESSVEPLNNGKEEDLFTAFFNDEFLIAVSLVLAAVVILAFFLKAFFDREKMKPIFPEMP
ncbi:MAG: transglutaminase domain-containing protein [Candidatus Diapherotrites archaeon]